MHTFGLKFACNDLKKNMFYNFMFHIANLRVKYLFYTLVTFIYLELVICTSRTRRDQIKLMPE